MTTTKKRYKHLHFPFPSWGVWEGVISMTLRSVMEQVLEMISHLPMRDDLFEDRFSISYNLDREFGFVDLILFWPKIKEHTEYCLNHPNEMSKLSKLKDQITENAWTGIAGNPGVIADMKKLKIWDAYYMKAHTFKTAIETSCMLLRIDDIVSGIKKKQAPGSARPLKPTIEQEGDADTKQMILE
ncbi:hypothetical protein L6452_25891 [Arctium lappa]|uniref:Uncharacterized protein n=1 Tax=Arctium lappa TaxID=4217 RepID=A0ACB9ABM0_ARCLA|nr:hypothetical protein L6452_25891 [Arctium lappa]